MGVDTSGGHPAMDYAQHKDTYKSFLRLTQILTAGLIALLLGMAYFLV